MKYSVLMSVYMDDSADHLKTALRSIYEDQIKKPDEIVIVFDGLLTDDLHKVLDEFAADKKDIVKFIAKSANRGLGEALRIGSQICTGDYIFRMDADDISDPLRFAKQTAYLESHPEIDVLGTDIAEFLENPNEKMRVRSCPLNHEDIVKMAKRRNPMNHVSVCIKRQALMICGGYEEIPLLEDYYLWLKMIVANCILANIHDSLVYVRIGNDFSEKRGSNRRVKGWYILQEYMLKHKLISRFDAIVNMFFICGFVYCPTFVRKLAYNRFLRG